jgi:hypothetical protein
MPVYFISHGGGPWSYMEDPSRAQYARLEASLAAMPVQIGTTPKAVLHAPAAHAAHPREEHLTVSSHRFSTPWVVNLIAAATTPRP